MGEARWGCVPRVTPSLDPSPQGGGKIIMLKQLLSEIKKSADPKRAEVSKWFFKTGPGQYGEGDVFVGLAVPQMRVIARKFQDLELKDILQLLNSKIHEHRFIALVILTMKFKKADDKNKKIIADFYLKNARNVNNWDLVDTSAPYILGQYLLERPRQVLYRLARSSNLWEKRISIIATQAFIKNNQFTDTLKISEILMTDTHDLIHKAVGWMLREVGNRDMKTELKFLDKHYRNMPRTALRYAIEKFPENLKRKYMEK